MSVRSDFADKLAAQLTELGLNDAYGVNVLQSHVRGKPYVITFCKARVLDAQLTVYGEKFILVKWHTAFRDMPSTGQEKFDSEAAAMQFVKDSFVR
jgi:hypothetical protein